MAKAVASSIGRWRVLDDSGHGLRRGRFDQRPVARRCSGRVGGPKLANFRIAWLCPCPSAPAATLGALAPMALPTMAGVTRPGRSLLPDAEDGWVHDAFARTPVGQHGGWR